MADWDRDRYGYRSGSGDYRVNYDRDRDYDRDYDRARDRWDYGRDFSTDSERTSGSSGNYFGGGGGYGTQRDYDTYRDNSAGLGQRQSYRGRGPKNFKRSDERLRELISERLEEHDDIDASDIEVTVANGEVTLSGSVDSRRTKRLAEDLAASAYGVNDVHNDLHVDRGFFARVKEALRPSSSS